MIKRILLPLGISALLLVALLVIGSIFVVVASQGQNQYNVQAVHVADLPVRPMKWVYYSLWPPTPEDYKQTLNIRKLAPIVFVYAGSVILYAIPIFLLITLISSRRKRREEPLHSEPPPPPTT